MRHGQTFTGISVIFLYIGTHLYGTAGINRSFASNEKHMKRSKLMKGTLAITKGLFRHPSSHQAFEALSTLVKRLPLAILSIIYQLTTINHQMQRNSKDVNLLIEDESWRSGQGRAEVVMPSFS